MENKRSSQEALCGSILCGGKTTGTCEVAKQMAEQALHGYPIYLGGIWPRKSWDLYVQSVRRVLPFCVHPEELEKALKEVKPAQFKEDLEVGE